MAGAPIGSYQRQETTWYHLPAKITVTENHIHMVRLPGLILPHPGVVNWIVRSGLPLQTRLELTALHEFGHLQTLPVLFLHLLLLLFWSHQRQSWKRHWMQFWIGLLAHQVVWEIAAEGYLVLTDWRAYRSPRKIRFQVLYGLFWTGMIVVSILSTLFFIRDTPSKKTK